MSAEQKIKKLGGQFPPSSSAEKARPELKKWPYPGQVRPIWDWVDCWNFGL